MTEALSRARLVRQDGGGRHEPAGRGGHQRDSVPADEAGALSACRRNTQLTVEMNRHETNLQCKAACSKRQPDRQSPKFCALLRSDVDSACICSYRYVASGLTFCKVGGLPKSRIDYVIGGFCKPPIGYVIMDYELRIDYVGCPASQKLSIGV